jgi:hypothetical protein
VTGRESGNTDRSEKRFRATEFPHVPPGEEIVPARWKPRRIQAAKDKDKERAGEENGQRHLVEPWIGEDSIIATKKPSAEASAASTLRSLQRGRDADSRIVFRHRSFIERFRTRDLEDTNHSRYASHWPVPNSLVLNRGS